MIWKGDCLHRALVARRARQLLAQVRRGRLLRGAVRRKGQQLALAAPVEEARAILDHQHLPQQAWPLAGCCSSLRRAKTDGRKSMRTHGHVNHPHAWHCALRLMMAHTVCRCVLMVRGAAWTCHQVRAPHATRPHPAVWVLAPAWQLLARPGMRQRHGRQNLLRRQLCTMHMAPRSQKGTGSAPCTSCRGHADTNSPASRSAQLAAEMRPAFQHLRHA